MCYPTNVSSSKPLESLNIRNHLTLQKKICIGTQAFCLLAPRYGPVGIR
jgi:hypothetical protein